MERTNRRRFLQHSGRALGAGLAAGGLPALIQKALAMPAARASGTIDDVQHIVVLMQENRSFDHYFGSYRGARGFNDRFPIPIATPVSAAPSPVWQQSGPGGAVIAPFHLDTQAQWGLMRTEGAAHTWPDAQAAWNQGRLNQWVQHKGAHAMGYYTAADLPFHHALAEAFTLCDAYHCAFQGGTTPNRLFHWTGTNDPQGQGQGPATFNDLESMQPKAGRPSYTWTTYPERLQAAGIGWQVYQDIADNYDDNSLAFFKNYRDAFADLAGADPALKARAGSTRDLDLLAADVLAGQLPQVSWIVAPERMSEHPGESSPAQGADYIARVLQALTANPEVWSRTVFLVNYDENDGFFDHMPPPAAPSCQRWHADPTQAQWAGASTVDTRGEYHEHLVSYRASAADKALLHQPYGLGPRVPLLVISPWSRGGWVNSQVFDHTSVIRFIEKRFGVHEPQISPWRRAVCGDLSTTLDFAKPSFTALPAWPATLARAAQARALPGRTMPSWPTVAAPLPRLTGWRPSRALPYQLHADLVPGTAPEQFTLAMHNSGSVAAVFHVYDRLHLHALPRRYTVEGGRSLHGVWDSAQGYDLWVLGPNGFHRSFCGPGSSAKPLPSVQLLYLPLLGRVQMRLHNPGTHACELEIQAHQPAAVAGLNQRLSAGGQAERVWNVAEQGHWYDLTVRAAQWPQWSCRFAGRMETGQDSMTDPAA